MWVQRLIIAALLILIIEGYISSKFGGKKISYKRFFDKKAIFEGEEIHLVEEISNLKILPVPWIRIESRIDENLSFYKYQNLNIKHKEYHTSIFSMMPFMKINRKHFIKCNKRGYYSLKTASMTYGSLFGILDNNSLELQTDAELIVYPKIMQLNKIKLSFHSWQGDMVVRRWILEDPFYINGTREYMQGDSMKRINWKATARTGSFQVKQYECTSDARLMILLNVDTSEEQWSVTKNTDLVEKAISFVAGVVKFAYENCIEVGFGSNGFLVDNEINQIRINCKSGKKQAEEIYTALAKLVVSRKISFHKFLENEIELNTTNIDYLIVSAYYSSYIEEKSFKLRKAGNSVEFFKIA